MPKNIKEIVQDKLKLMPNDSFHSSLRTKEIKGKNNIFESSINMNIRMTWQYLKDSILLRTIGEHNKTLKNP